MLDENGDSLLAEMKEHNELRKALISNLLAPNKLSVNQLSKSKHTFISSNQSIDSAIRATDLYYLGELGISEVTEDSKSLLYIEVISPDHLKGVSRFMLLNKTDSGWKTLNTFAAWQLSSDSTNFLIKE